MFQLMLLTLLTLPQQSEPVQFDFQPYNYVAKVVSVYDADTITADVDLGFRVRIEQTFRFSRINAFEVRGPEREDGLIARDWLRDQIPIGSTIYIQTEKDKTGKYGRYLCELYIRNHDGSWRNLNSELVAHGHAKFVEY